MNRHSGPDPRSAAIAALKARLAALDPAVFGRVAVLMGGRSAEREVSLDSGRNVLAALRECGVDAHSVDGVPALLEALRQDRHATAAGAAAGFDRVFNILHGGEGENGVLQGLLAAHGLPCTGSGVQGSALTIDKIRTKQVWLGEGLPTPRFVRIPPGGDLAAAVQSLGLPVFIKPATEGSSVGVFRIVEAAELAPAIAFATTFPGELLAERLVSGEEYTVGILGDLALPSVRIVPPGAWYDYHAKYVSEDTRYFCPGLDEGEEAVIGALALAAFRAAGCRGWGRVDLMRDRASGAFQLIEINTAPGMTSHSLVPKAARALGLEFDRLCLAILAQTLELAGP